MNKIHLPSLRGIFGDWNYFSSVIKVKDVVVGNRVITVPESEELYTKNINQILQREIDISRIKKIKNYLIENNERFFSSLILAIHKGDPRWSDFDLERHFKIENELMDDSGIEFIENKIGILTLSGNEEIFVLDGQHRLMGLRRGYEENKAIGDDEISIIMIVHKKDLKERTRRLFTVLNRYSVGIKAAEKVILDEDDAAAILTRRLVQNYKIFLIDRAVSSTKQFSLSPNDVTSFTTLVCLYEISKTLIDYSQLYKSKVIKRPSDEKLELLYVEIEKFWNYFFEEFSYIVDFINGKNIGSELIRNKETGGSLLLRPEGQHLFSKMYKKFQKEQKSTLFKDKVPKINFDLNGPLWKYVFWTGSKMNNKNKKLKESIFSYILGEKKLEEYIEKEMKEIYKIYNLSYKKTINLL